MEWSRVHLRSFPWRETTDPYRVFLAECLLKRTTSTAAVRTYETMLSKYPDVLSLSSAKTIEDNLRSIGLYKQRGKLMLEAARYVISELSGKIPADPAELEKIPGIGKYGATAIASFAFGKNVPVVDSNVIRVVRRFLGDENVSHSEAESLLSEAVKGKSSRTFNFGLIDLGSTVCRPVNPKCLECPLEPRCYNTIS